ncbi:hypothetical protein BMG523Draft_00768 [Frankia sp. BMG5.23]|nr:hypothetical protein BMG523Draft_00768 [Frankia sp. BMG5.23]
MCLIARVVATWVLASRSRSIHWRTYFSAPNAAVCTPRSERMRWAQRSWTPASVGTRVLAGVSSRVREPCQPSSALVTATADEILAKVRLTQTSIRKLVDNNRNRSR